jgi:hypothetical protein
MLREAYGNDALSQTMSGLANLQLQDLNHWLPRWKNRKSSTDYPRSCSWIHSWRSDNQDFYLVILRCLWDKIWRKRPEMWEDGSSIMTMHLHIVCCQWDNSRKRCNSYLSTTPLFTWPLPFEQCFQKWKRQWERCTAAQGYYFEWDNIQ